MDRIRVAACQVNTVVGDLSGNAGRILAALDEAERGGADLAVFPELAVTGYPPEDLLGRASFVDDNLAALAEVAASTRACAAVVGHVDRDPDGRLLNAASLCARGRILGSYHKRILPNYGVFDEERWFVPGRAGPRSFVVGGVAVGMSVCEDMWFGSGPMCEEADAGARVLVNLNASPYSRGRREERLAVLAERVAETGCPIVYVNQVGGQDELVFDGASLVMGADGELLGSARQFEEEVLLVDVEVPRAANGRRGTGGGTHADAVFVSGASRSEGLPPLAPFLAPVLGPEEEVYEALVLGTRDYVSKNGFSDAVIGLSGGIDSSLVATIAVDALGAEHVHGVTMPSRYSSEGSITDAVALGANLDIEVTNLGIEPVHREFASTLAPALGSEPAGLTDENLQSRLRGVLLMALSNANGWIVLTTGNKSEMATGYSTLYGDSAGGFAVIKDVAKTLVYELCLYRNKIAGFDLVPGPILTKAPSAELRPDQRDEESLPPYPVLDPVIAGYVEGDRSADDLIAEGYDPAVVGRVVELVDRAEYKRRQMPPGVRISTKAFGRDRRMPITNRYRTGRHGRGVAKGATDEEAPEVG
ncbi:MAG: NAD+ synthase [Acidimicrobiales bacterium]